MRDVKSDRDPVTGKPLDKTYLELGLPEYLQHSLDEMKACLERLSRGETDYQWDCYYCDLQSSINAAEVESQISSEVAWYLREKYLDMERGEVHY